jgi:hypothetical protein
VLSSGNSTRLWKMAHFVLMMYLLKMVDLSIVMLVYQRVMIIVGINLVWDI